MRKHAKEVHNDEQVKFEMSIVKRFQEDPLKRQVFEAIKIVESKEKDDFPLNTKNEFNQALIVTAKYTRGLEWQFNENEVQERYLPILNYQLQLVNTFKATCEQKTISLETSKVKCPKPI